MKVTVRRVGGIALALAALAVAPARGQETLKTPEAIRACLCQEQAVASLAAVLRQDNQNYEARRDELRALDERIETARGQLAANDLAGREALGRLLDERDAARNRFAAEVTPRHNEVVARYNAVAAPFNQQCAGKPYDAEILARMKASLSCPAVATEPGEK